MEKHENHKLDPSFCFVYEIKFIRILEQRPDKYTKFIYNLCSMQIYIFSHKNNHNALGLIKIKYNSASTEYAKVSMSKNISVQILLTHF